MTACPLVSVACLQIVADAEAWLAKLKRVLASSPSQSQQQGSIATSTGNSSVKAGSSLSRLRDLFAEGRRVPVNLDYEMRPLKAAIEAAQEWLSSHGELLGALGIVAPTVANAIVVGTKISYEKLFNCVNAASGISATFPELAAAREALRETDEWLAAAERCERPQYQQQQSQRRAGSKSTDQSSRRRKGQQSMDSQDNQDEDDDEATGYEETSFSSAPHRDVLLPLLARGQGLGVDLSAEMEMIECALAAIDEWEGSAGQALRDLDKQVAPVVQEYRRLAVATAGVEASEEAESLLPPLPFPSFEAARLEDYDDDVDGNDEDGEGDVDASQAKAVTSLIRDSRGDANKEKGKHDEKPRNNDNDRDGGGEEEEDTLALAMMRQCVEEEAGQWGKFVDFYVEVQRMQREASDLGVGLPQPAKADRGLGEASPPAVSTNSFVTLELSAAALYWIYSVRKLLLYPSTQPPDDPRLVTHAPTTSSSNGSHSRTYSGGVGASSASSARPNKKKDKKGAVAGDTTVAMADAGATEDSSSSPDHKDKDGEGDGDARVAAAASKGGVVGGDFGFGDIPLDLIQTLIRDAETYFENTGSTGNADRLDRLAAMEAVYASTALAKILPPPPPESAMKEEVVEADAADVGDADDDGEDAAARKRRKVDTSDDIGDDAEGESEGQDDSLTAMMATGVEDATEGHELDGNDNNGRRKKRTATSREDSSSSGNQTEVRAPRHCCGSFAATTSSITDLNAPLKLTYPFLATPRTQLTCK